MELEAEGVGEILDAAGKDKVTFVLGEGCAVDVYRDRIVIETWSKRMTIYVDDERVRKIEITRK